MAFMPEWVRASWLPITFDRLTRDGYATNAAVFQCVSALAFGYNEPPVVVQNAKGERQANHPLQVLLDRPNPLMSHAELMTFTIIYKAVGGQAYWHKVRGRGGQVVELWPYHAGQVAPVPSRYEWVSHYEFDAGDGIKVRAEAKDVVHLKWPSIDLEQPWLALPPLRAVAREVDTDSEMTAYLYALLKNDAVPRGVITTPTGVGLSPTQAEKLKAQFYVNHGGLNRGNVAILEQGATYSRTSLNLHELAFEAMRRIPESRIAGAFRVPAILAGLYVGLEKATYANYREARQQLTEDTFVPLWKADATELTQAFRDEFSGDVHVVYDTSNVAALQENEDSKYTRILNAYDKSVVTKNEARLYLGFSRVGELQIRDEGDTFKSEPQPQAPGAQIIDAIVEPRQLTDEQKSLQRKAPDRRTQIQRQMERDVAAVLRAEYEAAVP